MREIRYKAQGVNSTWWHEGFIAPDLLDRKRKTWWIAPNGKEERWYKINPNTICQYTGIKDCNKMRIYENDRVEYAHHMDSNTYTAVVAYNEEEACFEIRNEDFHFTTQFDFEWSIAWIKVIGNIYD